MMAQASSNPIQNLLLEKLLFGKNLTVSEIKIFLTAASAKEEIDINFFKSFLLLLRHKDETSDEIWGMVAFLRAQSKLFNIDLPYLVDNCGTGGDGKGTFNISTVSALVAAGAGAHVAKHGNRAASSKVGSSDLLQALGINILAAPERMLEILRRTGFGYFHAPLYHPVLGKFVRLRREIRGRTIFNLLGPLLNPLSPKRQVIGLGRRELLLKMAKTIVRNRPKVAYVICGEGGLDEISPYGKTQGYLITNTRIRSFLLEPFKYGIKKGSEKDLRGGSLQQNAQIVKKILLGKIRDSKRDAVLLNAALTLLASGRARSFDEGLTLAGNSLDSGRALHVLTKTAELSN